MAAEDPASFLSNQTIETANSSTATSMCPSISENPTKSTASPEVKLVEARNQKQIEKCLKENYSAWGGSLSEEMYFNREATLARCDFAKSSQKTWVLIEQEKNEATCLDILSACETYFHECVIAFPPSKVDDTSPTATVLKGKCLAIASVFTTDRHRKKGYASKLLSKLLERARNGMDGVIASTLYSDIGPSYYAKMGWKCYPSYSLCLDLTNAKADVDQMETFANLEFIELAQTIPLIEMAAFKIPSTIAVRSKKLGKPVFSMIPTFTSQAWLWARSEYYYANLYSGNKTKLKYCGIKCRESSSFVLFMLDFKECILKVTLMSVDQEKDAASLLLALTAHAREWKLNRVEIWDPPSELERWSLQVGYRLEARQDHLSSLCLSGFSSSSSSAETDAAWLNNEKLYWV